jgi:hypothetical protein
VASHALVREGGWVGFAALERWRRCRYWRRGGGGTAD